MIQQNLYIFDFDGTLTTRDTLIEFIRYAHGTAKTLWGFLLYSPLLVLMKLRLYPNYKAKQKIFAHFFQGMPIGEFDQTCHRFAEDNRSRLLRPQAVAFLRQTLACREPVMVVSASIDNWVKPFFTDPESAATPAESQTDPLVLGTQIEVKDGRVTGRFLTPNCYGAEKVRRVEAVLKEPRSHYHIRAYGDSRGDKELLEYADESFFKPFRS
jgi:phosphatidylglycerophosphatase C